MEHVLLVQLRFLIWTQIQEDVSSVEIMSFKSGETVKYVHLDALLNVILK